MKGNIIVGQSGGPTAAINSSLAGVYRTAIDRGAKKVYGMRHGIQGLLNEDYIDLPVSSSPLKMNSSLFPGSIPRSLYAFTVQIAEISPPFMS